MVGCNSYRNPALLAKITSTVDVISGGRLDWGIGAGWYENEYKGYGYEFPAPKVRIGMLRECVEIVKSMWTEPETTYDGRYYTIARRAAATPSRCSSRTRRSGSAAAASSSPCASSPAYADRSNFGGKPDEFAHKCEVLKDHCKDVGRDYDEIRKTWSPRGVHPRDRGRGDGGRHRGRSGASRSSRGPAGNLVGTPEQVAEKIKTYVDLGCTGFVPVVHRLPRHRDAAPPRREGACPQFR